MKCSSCHQDHDREGQRYCLDCHARYMREHRPKHSQLTDLQRHKANCRAYANTYKRRGKLDVKSCQECGRRAEMHHKDYSRPLDVTWLCRECHLELHKAQPDACYSDYHA